MTPTLSYTASNPAPPIVRFNHAHLERCEYCHCNRHTCGCEERFDYEAIRDNPTLFAR